MPAVMCKIPSALALPAGFLIGWRQKYSRERDWCLSWDACAGNLAFTAIEPCDFTDVALQLQDAVDKTKVNVTAEGVKQNMQDDSEKASIFGTKPVSGTTLGRPELERRPETGDRSLGSVMAFDGPAPETINGRLVSRVGYSL